MRLAWLLCGVLMLGACSSAPKTPPPPPARASNETVSRTGSDLTQAATTPLSDLNLVNAPIPAVLADAQRAPYGEPADGTCSGLKQQIEALDVVLGADLDQPPSVGNPGLLERGVGLVGQTATQSVRGAAESVVPFRSWVRRLTGAERYSRDVAAAIAAGTVRRSFLKGLGQARGCQPPAAPATVEKS